MKSKIGPFGNRYTQFYHEATGAVNFLILKQEGEVITALYHKSIGDIDLPWGEEGTNRSDGFGLSKLIKWHPEVVDKLQEILNDMKVVKKTKNKVELKSKQHKATVKLFYDGEDKNWLLTAYKVKKER